MGRQGTVLAAVELEVDIVTVVVVVVWVVVVVMAGAGAAVVALVGDVDALVAATDESVPMVVVATAAGGADAGPVTAGGG
jgi:hypothetical protein